MGQQHSMKKCLNCASDCNPPPEHDRPAESSTRKKLSRYLVKHKLNFGTKGVAHLSNIIEDSKPENDSTKQVMTPAEVKKCLLEVIDSQNDEKDTPCLSAITSENSTEIENVETAIYEDKFIKEERIEIEDECRNNGNSEGKGKENGKGEGGGDDSGDEGKGKVEGKGEGEGEGKVEGEGEDCPVYEHENETDIEDEGTFMPPNLLFISDTVPIAIPDTYTSFQSLLNELSSSPQSDCSEVTMHTVQSIASSSSFTPSSFNIHNIKNEILSNNFIQNNRSRSSSNINNSINNGNNMANPLILDDINVAPWSVLSDRNVRIPYGDSDNDDVNDDDDVVDRNGNCNTREIISNDNSNACNYNVHEK